MEKSLVSILIPVYNREKLIRRALDSAINQTYRNIEIIAFDNKSTDRTYEILKRYAEIYPNVKVYQNNRNLGPVKNWIKCLNHSSGEYIKILFSDDWIEKSFVEKSLEILHSYKSIGFVFTATLIHHKEKKRICYNFSKKTGVFSTMLFIKGSILSNNFPASPCNALFRRTDVENNLILDIPNNFNIDFKKSGAGNDSLLFLLTALKYPYFGYISTPLSHFDTPADSITMNTNLGLNHLIARSYFVDHFHIENDFEKYIYSQIFLLNIINKGKFKQLVKMNKVDISKISRIIINNISGKLGLKHLALYDF